MIVVCMKILILGTKFYSSFFLDISCFSIYSFSLIIIFLGNFIHREVNSIVKVKNQFCDISKKPLHFREGKKCQKPQKWSQKELILVSRAVLSTDKDDVEFFENFYWNMWKKSSYMHKYMISSIFWPTLSLFLI